MVSNQRHDRGIHDQATPRSSIPYVQRSFHGRDPGSGSRDVKFPARKVTTRKVTARKRQAKERQGLIFLSLILPVGQHHRSVLGEVKNGRNGKTHAHAIFWRCMYTLLSFAGSMTASAFTSYLQQLSLSYLTHFYLLI